MRRKPLRDREKSIKLDTDGIRDAILKDVKSNSPRVDDPNERGVVLVTEVGREGRGRKDVAVYDFPAPPVGLPLDASHEVYDLGIAKV